MLTGYFLWEMKTCVLLPFIHTHMHTQQRSRCNLWLRSVHCILTIHGVRSLIQSQLHYNYKLCGGFFGGFFPLVFYQLKFSFFTWLTISYRCTCHSSSFPSLLYSVMCGVLWGAVSRFCWWYMNSSSAAAALLRGSCSVCPRGGEKQMRLTQGSSAPPG